MMTMTSSVISNEILRVIIIFRDKIKSPFNTGDFFAHQSRITEKMLNPAKAPTIKIIVPEINNPI